jgi:hypothetical protein
MLAGGSHIFFYLNKVLAGSSHIFFNDVMFPIGS